MGNNRSNKIVIDQPKRLNQAFINEEGSSSEFSGKIIITKVCHVFKDKFNREGYVEIQYDHNGNEIASEAVVKCD